MTIPSKFGFNPSSLNHPGPWTSIYYIIISYVNKNILCHLITDILVILAILVRGRDHQTQIWFSCFRGEDLDVIFYQNMPNLHNRYKSSERKISQKNPE
jgi:hypothetical protein